jgi:hypothetical protein
MYVFVYVSVSLIIIFCVTNIEQLSLNPNNNPKFNAAGACETLVDALKVHLMEYHCGAEVCSGAILNLVTYGVSAKDNREEFRRVGSSLYHALSFSYGYACMY